MFSNKIESPFSPAVLDRLMFYHAQTWKGERQTSIHYGDDDVSKTADARVILIIQENWNYTPDELEELIRKWLTRNKFDHVVLWCDHARDPELMQDTQWSLFYRTVVRSFYHYVHRNKLTVFIGHGPGPDLDETLRASRLDAGT